MKRGSLAVVLGVAMGFAATSASAADDINNLAALTQAEFKKLSEDLASATSYKGLTPAEPLGITGFDIGLEVTDTSLQYDDAFDKACSGCGLDNLVIPKLHLHKGLPLGFDVGLMYASTSNTNVTLTGVELRYANIEGGLSMPAVATRFSWSRLDGVDDLSLESKGIDVSVSKGFAMFTPYVGIGYNWVTSEPSASTGLDDEDFTQTKYFVGMNINTGFLNFDLEMDETGGAQTLGAKVGFRF
ncbi:MAG: hypothetical protein OQL08_11595 [Gammaproteobacteria bacterium]|nr:hypothetical protein [Gammaproteobacteria bacterium]